MQTSTVTRDPLNTVILFYDRHLGLRLVPDNMPLPGDEGEWIKKKLRESTYLYACYGVDINRLTTETGCIYVRSEGKDTRIDIVLIRAEGGYMPCPIGQ